MEQPVHDGRGAPHLLRVALDAADRAVAWQVDARARREVDEADVGPALETRELSRVGSARRRRTELNELKNKLAKVRAAVLKLERVPLAHVTVAMAELKATVRTA